MIDQKKKRISKFNLIEFIEHSVKYMFAVSSGMMVTGIPTVRTHTKKNKSFISDMNLYAFRQKNRLELKPFKKSDCGNIEGSKIQLDTRPDRCDKNWKNQRSGLCKARNKKKNYVKY